MNQHRTKSQAPAPSTVTGACGEQMSFLPPPPFCPTWPTKGTLADRALGYLMDGARMNHPEFEARTQSWRLGAVVFQLRTLGWPVETVEIPAPTAENPNRIIARYHLAPHHVAQALAQLGAAR